MYPSHQHDHERYIPEAHQGHVPSPGIPNNIPKENYHPPYNASSLRIQVRVPSEPWSTRLCHCCDDPANCLITSFCPCITFGQIAEIVNKGSSTCATNGLVYALLGLTGLPCLYSCFFRSKLRGQYDLEESPCVDCLVHFCCEMCALCQEYRELKNRGFDMGIGWQANLERQSRGVTVAPFVEEGMRR